MTEKNPSPVLTSDEFDALMRSVDALHADWEKPGDLLYKPEPPGYKSARAALLLRPGMTITGRVTTDREGKRFVQLDTSGAEARSTR